MGTCFGAEFTSISTTAGPGAPAAAKAESRVSSARLCISRTACGPGTARKTSAWVGANAQTSGPRPLPPPVVSNATPASSPSSPTAANGRPAVHTPDDTPHEAATTPHEAATTPHEPCRNAA